MYFHFIVLVDDNIDNGFIFVRKVFDQIYLHCHVAETFVLVVFFDDGFRSVDNVLSNLIALDEVESFLKVLGFAFLSPDVVDLTDTGLSAENDFEPGLVTVGLDQLDTCLREEFLTHESFDGICDVVARNADAVTDFEVGVSEDKEVIVVRGTFNLDAGNFVSARHGCVENRWSEDCVGRSLGRSLGECGSEEY